MDNPDTEQALFKAAALRAQADALRAELEATRPRWSCPVLVVMLAVGFLAALCVNLIPYTPCLG